LVLGVMLCWSGRAEAYPWMIRHGYANCVTCHADPSGSGLLTEYGRAQSEVLLSTRWGKGASSSEPSKFSGSLFGLLPTNETFDAGGWFRDGYYVALQDQKGGLAKVDDRFLQMRWDLAARLSIGAFRAYGSIGVSDPNASATYPRELVTTFGPQSWNVESREFWAGATFADESVTVRAGRMNVPFGLRIPEHISWVRTVTRTDFNQNQQYGVAASYSGEKVRAEVMAIAGNYQVSPDAFRDRGYSLLAEWHAADKWGVGLSSSVVHASTDLELGKGAIRQAHGVFARGEVIERLAVMAEVDVLANTLDGDTTRAGFVGFLQADEELTRGVHLLLTGEALLPATAGAATFGRYWLGAQWFAFTHFDVRADAIVQPPGGGAQTSLTLLAQANVYL
jgi:hypothetical protein